MSLKASLADHGREHRLIAAYNEVYAAYKAVTEALEEFCSDHSLPAPQLLDYSMIQRNVRMVTSPFAPVHYALGEMNDKTFAEQLPAFWLVDDVVIMADNSGILDEDHPCYKEYKGRKTPLLSRVIAVPYRHPQLPQQACRNQILITKIMFGDLERFSKESLAWSIDQVPEDLAHDTLMGALLPPPPAPLPPPPLPTPAP